LKDLQYAENATKKGHGVICLVVINSKIFIVGLKDLNDGNPN
jgi:hypothetical protein